MNTVKFPQLHEFTNYIKVNYKYFDIMCDYKEEYVEWLDKMSEEQFTYFYLLVREAQND